jgi:hypothetical protein
MLIFLVQKKKKEQGKERKGLCLVLGLSEANTARTSIEARPNFNYFFMKGDDDMLSTTNFLEKKLIQMTH